MNDLGGPGSISVSLANVRKCCGQMQFVATNGTNFNLEGQIYVRSKIQEERWSLGFFYLPMYLLKATSFPKVDKP